MQISKIRYFKKRSSEIGFIEDLYFFEENGVRGWDGEGHYDDYDFMLPTGLADVDGVEIYEGDIVRFQTFDAIDVVVFDPPCFKTKNYSLQGYECKVIGNIYQTPELASRSA